MMKPTTAFLHYSAPPIVGGVEAVMDAHARVFLQNGYPVTIVSGRGSPDALPPGCGLTIIPEIDSQQAEILAAGKILEQGEVPLNFAELVGSLRDQLAPLVSTFDNLIVHNVFSKHFNLPLTAALSELLDEGAVGNCIAWHHDFTWTSPRSRSKVHAGYPWDLLRRYRRDMVHVTVSEERRRELAGLYGCDKSALRVIYNGVDPALMFGLSGEGRELVERLGLLTADLIILMPVRVTRAKQIDYALEFAAALKTAGTAVKLVLTGPPDPHDDKSMAYFRSLQTLRDDLGLQDAMHFVFESGSQPDESYIIGLDVVAGLYRVADLMFMPSLQEGFGMPVLEAGLIGLPVLASDRVPAAEEIGAGDVQRFTLDTPPEELADRVLAWAAADKRLHLAQRVRKELTWNALFRNEIEPLLVTGKNNESVQ